MNIIGIIEGDPEGWPTRRIQNAVRELLSSLEIKATVFDDIAQAERSQAWKEGFDLLIIDGDKLRSSELFRETARDCILEGTSLAAVCLVVSLDEPMFEFCFPECSTSELLRAKDAQVPEKHTVDSASYANWLKSNLVFNIGIGPNAQSWEGILLANCKALAAELAAE